MKKVLVGVGIGCGALVLLVMVGLGVAGYWAKKKLGGVVEAGQQMQAQVEEMKKLDEQFAFTPPPEGQVLALQEARLTEYFAIREAAMPLFKEFEQKAESLKAHTNNGPSSVSQAFEATSLVSQLITQARSTYIENLKKHRMSPSEFHSITTAIYSSQMAGAAEGLQDAMGSQHESLQATLSGIQERLQDDTLSAEERAALEEQESALSAQLDATAEVAQGAQQGQLTGEARQTASANLALLEKYKERIAQVYNPGFDALIVPVHATSPYGHMGGGSGGGVDFD